MLSLLSLLPMDALSMVPMDALPHPKPETPPGMGKMNTILNWLVWGSFTVCLGVFILSGAVAATSAIGGRPMGHAGKVAIAALVGTVIAGSAGLIISALT